MKKMSCAYSIALAATIFALLSVISVPCYGYANVGHMANSLSVTQTFDENYSARVSCHFNEHKTSCELFIQKNGEEYLYSFTPSEHGYEWAPNDFHFILFNSPERGSLTLKIFRAYCTEKDLSQFPNFNEDDDLAECTLVYSLRGKRLELETVEVEVMKALQIETRSIKKN